jgi:hypothetical protein
LGVEQGRILARNPESQGQADWPLSNDLCTDEFRPIETGIGQIAAPPVIYADDNLMNAYCTGVVRGFSDYHASQEQPAYVPGDYAYTEMYDGSNGPLVCLYEPKQKDGN